MNRHNTPGDDEIFKKNNGHIETAEPPDLGVLTSKYLKRYTFVGKFWNKHTFFTYRAETSIFCFFHGVKNGRFGAENS